MSARLGRFASLARWLGPIDAVVLRPDGVVDSEIGVEERVTELIAIGYRQAQARFEARLRDGRRVVGRRHEGHVVLVAFDESIHEHASSVLIDFVVRAIDRERPIASGSGSSGGASGAPAQLAVRRPS